VVINGVDCMPTTEHMPTTEQAVVNGVDCMPTTEQAVVNGVNCMPTTEQAVVNDVRAGASRCAWSEKGAGGFLFQLL
jgi:hypothetical protein